MIQKIQYTCTAKTVNSKILANCVKEITNEMLQDGFVNWQDDGQRATFIEVLEMELAALRDDNLITNYSVVCDLRNNKVADMLRGEFVLDIKYKQIHCLNTTTLTYNITASDNVGILDFYIP